MKKFFALIATSLTLSGMSAHAIVGGPWDNNNYNQTNSGTYNGTMYISNGLGMFRFTDDTTAQFAQLNQSVVFYRGAVYLGGCFGSVDWVNNRVTGITNGDTVNNFVDSGSGTNIDTCNTKFICSITERAPIMRFAGRGQANFFGDLDQIDIQTTTTTTVIEGDTETTIDITETSSGGENSSFTSSLGHQRSIYVYGAQISEGAVTVLPAAGGAGAGGVGGQTVVQQGGAGG